MSWATTVRSAPLLQPLELLRRRRQHLRQVAGEGIDVARLVEVSVLAGMHEVRQRHRVRRDDGQTRGHRLHGGDALQLGARRHREHGRAGERRAQLVVADLAGERGAVGDAERARLRLELPLHLAVADDLHLHVERRVELGDRLEQLVDVLLFVEPPEEGDDVARCAARSRRCSRASRCRTRSRACRCSPVCCSKKSAARRVGAVISSAFVNHLRADVHWMRVSQPCMNGGRIAHVLEHVLGHRVVRADEADAVLDGRRSPARGRR